MYCKPTQIYKKSLQTHLTLTIKLHLKRRNIMRTIHIRLTNILLSVFVLLSGYFYSPVTAYAENQSKSNQMEVHFIDVGQGDCTLITCDGQSLLIDTADESKGTAIQSYLRKQNIEKLDYLILTHPDSDHIGGAPVIITKFGIENIFMSNYEKDNLTYEKLIQAMDYKRFKFSTPAAGSQFQLGAATITILAPCKSYDNPNDASVALMVQNGDNKFLFTGDATNEAETDILESHADISADVYKVGHHGSKTSTSADFFHAVHPQYAVISCGEGNSYGHPHAQTLNTLLTSGVEVYRTDEDGTIVAVSDGKTITFNVPASKTWKSGEPVGSTQNSQNSIAISYVLNTNTHKFHRPTCDSVDTIKDKNRKDSTDSRDVIIGNGFVPCKICKP